MNRIDTTFAALKKDGRKGLIGYLTAGDPDIETSEANIRAALDNGLDILELGVPFSDPTADGPTIQAAAFRAVSAGTTLCDVIALVKRLREDYDQPIVLFGYTNPLFRYGYAEACRDAAQAGADGLLVVDLPFEEAGEILEHTKASQLCFVPLVAPTTSSERMSLILKEATGFVYYIMVTGVTGARAELASDLVDKIAMVRGATPLPIGVGFGVSNGEQARVAAEHADAVVVGSAFVQAARDGVLAEKVREIAEAVHGG